MNPYSKAGAYAKMASTTGIENANPHQLIQMLYQGALDSLQQAIGFIKRKEYDGKARTLGKAISIIGGLQCFLDQKKGGEIAENLDSLYTYMTERLYTATAANDTEAVEEVISLLREIKTGWDGIADEAKAIYDKQKGTV